MSFVITTPELVTTVAGNLANIGSTLQQAVAAAAGPTTGVGPAAADEVSAAIAQLFGTFGREFQTVSARGAAFHADFVNLLNSGATAYLAADVANAGQNLLSAATPFAAATTVPGSAYQGLLTNTVTNLQALGSAWSANQFPLLRQFLANQQAYGQQIAAAFSSAVQNFPANLANLPAAVQAAFQQILTFNAPYYLQLIAGTQLGFAQTFFTAAADGVTGLVTGLPNFASGLGLTFQDLAAGNYNAAVSDLGRTFLNYLITGFDLSNFAVNFDLSTLTATGSLRPVLLGPLGDLFTIMNIPGQEAQFLTDLMPPSLPRQVAQNFTNLLDTLTVPSIEADLFLPIANLPATSVSAYFGVPLVLAYATLGAPFATLDAMATSLAQFNSALAAGSYLDAFGTLVDAPAAALNGFLNGNTPIDTVISVPTNLPAPVAPALEITLHLPFDGLLVPPHPVTTTLDLPNTAPLPDISTTVTILGTPFSGLAPLLINYIPQQLAAAIRPA